MSEPHAYDMSQYQRIINVDGGRVTGSFSVMPGNRDGEVWVNPIDVVVWDEGHNSGRVIYSGDIAAVRVADGAADVNTRGPKADDIEDARAEFVNACVLAAAVFPSVALSASTRTGEPE